MTKLNEMNIFLEGIGHALADNMLSVPIYQRSYAWEDRHVKDLYQDIANAINEGEKEYFLGSIVITENTSDRPEVVDGQQRLATTTILIAAIRDWFYENEDTDRVEDIEREFLITRDLRTQEKVSKLRLNEIDQDFFSKTILSKPDSPERSVASSKESHKKITKASEIAADHLRNIVELSNKPADRLIDWIDYLKTGVRVIWVKVPDDANAFTIFETLNDRGLDLAISDLLKNYLFHLSGDRISEAQQRWVSMFAALEAVDSEEIVVDYIRHPWSSKYGSTRQRDLYDGIKKRITSKQSAIDFANELAENAKLYAAILNPDHEIWSSYGSTSRSHIVTINLLRMVQIRPLLLAILAEYDREEVKKTLSVMVSWAVRFLIYGGLGGGTLEKYYSDGAKDISSGSVKTAQDLLTAMTPVVPTDGQFESAFTTATVSKNYLARYYLRALEKESCSEPDPELVPNPNEEIVNLEHVLPEHPSEKWAHIDDEIVKIYYKRIGNLALTKMRINSDVGNDGFHEKRSFYANSDFQLTSSIADFDNWGPEEIEKRQKELAKLAVRAWPSKI